MRVNISDQRCDQDVVPDHTSASLASSSCVSGNDLARILRWGAGYSGEDPHHILVSVDEADEVLMDRWTILLDAQDVSQDGGDNNFLEPPKVWG